MHVNQSRFIAAATALVVAGTFAAGVALSQGPPPPGPQPGFQGMDPQRQMMMMGNMNNFQVVNEPGVMYIVRPDRVIRIDKSSFKIAGEVMLPGPGRPMAPSGGG